jgi:hypothetical protein
MNTAAHSAPPSHPAWKHTPTLSRSCVLYAVLALAVVACGLLLARRFHSAATQWRSNNGNDALGVLVVFVGFCCGQHPRWWSLCWRVVSRGASSSRSFTTRRGLMLSAPRSRGD